MIQSVAAKRFGIPINTINRHYRGNPKAPITWTDKTCNMSQLCFAQRVGISKSITTGHPMVLMHDEERKRLLPLVKLCKILVWIDVGDGGLGSLRLLTINKKA